MYMWMAIFLSFQRNQARSDRIRIWTKAKKEFLFYSWSSLLLDQATAGLGKNPYLVWPNSESG